MPAIARPVLNPALRRLWRDTTTLQVGVDPGRALVIGGLDAASARLVESLDGTLDGARLPDHAASLGVPPDRARRLLDLLADAGVLVDAAADVSALSALDLPERDRLAPDLASMSLVHDEGAATVMARRRAAAVAVRGLERVGSLLCLLLGAAGVGRVVPEDPLLLRPGDLSCATPGRGAVGQRRQDAVRETLAVLAPATRSASLKGRRPLDLVVLAPAGAVPAPETVDDLVRRGTPHLLVTVRETTGVVGPFVLPGMTACLRCQSLGRADRDPGWPGISAQLASTRVEGAACDTVLAALTAAQAALQVLTFLDSGGATLPPAAGGTVEIELPGGQTRRRTWAAHPACGCRWTGLQSPRSTPLEALRCAPDAEPR